MSNDKVIYEQNEDGVYVPKTPSATETAKATVKRIFKSTGRLIIALGILAALTLIVLMIVKGGVWAGQKAYPLLSGFSRFTLLITVLILAPLALFKRTRMFAGLGIFAVSYILGFTLWMWSLLLTYNLWGVFAVILGLFFLGVGIVPIALLAAVFNAQWSTLAQLLLLAAFVPLCRALGVYLAGSGLAYRNSSRHF